MKSSLLLLVLVLLLVNILAGCAPGPNQSKGTASEHDAVAGFWLGLWQGFIAPFVFVASLFKSNLNIYEVHNNGAWYNFGSCSASPASSAPVATGQRVGSKSKQSYQIVRGTVQFYFTVPPLGRFSDGKIVIDSNHAEAYKADRG